MELCQTIIVTCTTDPAIVRVHYEDHPASFLLLVGREKFSLPVGYGKRCEVDAIERVEDWYLPLWSRPRCLLQVPLEKEIAAGERGSVTQQVC